jgi:hypothetical protein
MLPDDRFGLESTARTVRRRLIGERAHRPRAERFAPSDWPPSRGPTRNPRRD